MTKQAHDSVRYTLSTLAVEGLRPSDTAIRFCEKIADHEMSSDEAVDKILQFYGLERKSTNV